MNMKWYWGKIAITAAVIFGVGYAGISVARSTREHVVSAVESNADLTIPLPFLPFNFDGAKFGTFRKVVLHRSTPEHVESVEVTVRLNDPSVLTKLGDCNLTVEDPSRLNENSSFRCVTVDETMENFGSVVVMTRSTDGRWTRATSVPLVLPKDVARRIQGREAQEHASQLEADRFRELGDSVAVLARLFAGATSDSARDALKEQMDDLQTEMNDLRESIVEAASERAAAAAEAAADAATRTIEVKVATPAAPKPADAPKVKAPPAPPG